MEEKYLKLLEENERLKHKFDELERRHLALLDQNNQNEELLAQLQEQTKKLKSAKKALRYKMVTVLFANIYGFSKLSETLDSEALIDKGTYRLYFLLKMKDKKPLIHQLRIEEDEE